MHSTPPEPGARPESATSSSSRASKTCVSCAWFSPISSASARTFRFRSASSRTRSKDASPSTADRSTGSCAAKNSTCVLRPDPTTFAIYPWPAPERSRGAADLRHRDARRPAVRRLSAHDAAASHRKCRRAAPDLRVGLEVEFYLFAGRRADGASTSTGDVGSYFDFSANDRGEEARNAIVAALQSMGVPVASAHHEHGAGQHEIDRRARRSARRRRSRADAPHARASTSPPRSISTPRSCPNRSKTAPGTDCTWTSGSAREPTRPTALYVVGGLLAHAPAATAICNPTVNSYKRLVAAWDAPIYTVWSHRSANALVRVPPERIAAARRDAQPRPGVQPVSGARRPDRRCRGRSARATLARSAPRRLDLRPRRAGATRARNRHAAEIARAKLSTNSTATPWCARRWATIFSTHFATLNSKSTSATAARSIPGSANAICACIDFSSHRRND